MDDPVSWQGALVCVEMGFTGPKNGKIVLVAPVAFGAELAANLLGAEPGSPEIESGTDDAVGEFVNIMSGMLLEAWMGKEAVCRLASPTVKRAEGGDADGCTDGACCVTQLIAEDEHRVDVAVFVEE